jgi:hypothetical protein
MFHYQQYWIRDDKLAIVSMFTSIPFCFGGLYQAISWDTGGRVRGTLLVSVLAGLKILVALDVISIYNATVIHPIAS